MGVNLHLLTEGTASNETVNKGRHTWPPIVMGQQGICAEETAMLRGKGQVDSSDKVMMGSRRYIEVVFKIQVGCIIPPICNGRMREERGAIVEVLQCVKDKGIGCR